MEKKLTKSQIKSQQLGEPFSNANWKLVKSILFDLIVKSELNHCYRCGEIIETGTDLSIEHKKPWLHTENPRELFFDLDNIAFSHISCNSKSIRYMSGINGVRAKSGLKGVCYDSKARGSKKWRAYIKNPITNSNETIGRFLTKEEAGQAYDEVAIKFYGDNVLTNKMLGLL